MAESTKDNQKSAEYQQENAPVRGLVSWGLYDFANSSFWTVIQTFVFAAYFTRAVAPDENTGTFLWGITISLVGVVVALAGPLLGATVDNSGPRKPWIGAFTVLGIVAMALLWFVKPSAGYVWLALGLVFLSGLGAEISFIFYNAMLPRLVPPERMGRWSGWGWALGYAGGVGCLAFVLLALVWPQGDWLGLDPGEAEHLRATSVGAAGWFLIFSLPLFFLTPDIPATGKSLGRAARDGCQQLWETLHQVRRYSQVFRFLVAELIYRNGLTALFTFGGIYAAGTFGMEDTQILAFGIALNVASGIGAMALSWVDDWIGAKRTLLLSLVGLAIPCVIILLVHTQLLFWIFGLLLALFIGPLQAASRSFLARIAPRELQSQMFGLHSFAGKATAFLAPALVGLVTYLTASQRIGMSTILIFIIAGFAVLWFVPSDQRQQAEK